jgi:aminobenzoyl-glutamate utilization protein B
MKRIALCILALSFAWAYVQCTRAQESKTLDDFKREAVVEVDKSQKLIQEMVDSIFSFAERGFQEYETSKYLTGILEKNGFKVERNVADIPTAWVASYGSGKPVIGFITDIDCIPRASQKPGVAYHDPIIQNAPGHGEGHNSGQAVNVAATIVLKQLMEKYKLPGTLKLYPGVAEELVATKAFFVRAGLFKDVDIMLGAHVGNDFETSWGAARTQQRPGLRAIFVSLRRPGYCWRIPSPTVSMIRRLTVASHA